MTPDLKNLVVVAGPRVWLYDTSTWDQKYGAFEFPNDPARILLSPDSQHVLATFADHDNGVNRQRAQTFDLSTGSATSPSIPLEFDAGLASSPDGRSVLLWQKDKLNVLDFSTLSARTPEMNAVVNRTTDTAARPMNPRVVNSDFSADGAKVDALVVDEHGAGAWLVSFDAVSGTQTDNRQVHPPDARDVGISGGRALEFAMLPGRHSAIVQREDVGPLSWDEEHGARDIDSRSSEYGALALSPDGTMFVRSLSGSTVLISTQTLDWLSPPLPAALARVSDPRSEHITQLAFVEDGSGVIGRTRRGLALFWDIRADVRPADELLHEAMLLGGGAIDNDQALRLRLRAEDKGPRTYATPLSELHAPTELPVARRPEWVDLSMAYNDHGGGSAPIAGSELDLPEFAFGMHRFFGVDYDARGAISLATKGFKSSANTPWPQRVGDISPILRRFNALDVLVTGRGTLTSDQVEPYAYVVLTYRNGSTARLPIDYKTDINEFWSDAEGNEGESSPRIAWRASRIGTPPLYRLTVKVYAVRLVNPHADLDVEAIAFEAAEKQWSAPSFLALTLEP